MVYKCDRGSLKAKPPFKRWIGSKSGKVIPSRVPISKGLAEECARHYYDLDQEEKQLEAERQIIYSAAEEKKMLLQKVESEGPIKALRFRNTIQGLGRAGEVVAIEEIWQWDNTLAEDDAEGEGAISDRIRLISWSPDTYRPRDVVKERIVTPSEAATINRTLAKQGMSVKQLEAEIRQLEGKANHIGTQLADLSKRQNEPLVIQEAD